MMAAADASAAKMKRNETFDLQTAAGIEKSNHAIW